MKKEKKVRRRVSFSVPEDENPAEESEPHASCTEAVVSSFGEMNLDARVERAVERIGWRKPTPVQSAVIPVALTGRDMLVNSPTGSGKTAAYGIPIAQCLCQWDSTQSGAHAVLFVPTRELVQQVTVILKSLFKYIDGVRVAAILGNNRTDERKPKRSKFLNDDSSNFDSTADVLVGTPSSIARLCDRSGTNIFEAVKFVVVDEADLVLSYGFEADARRALAMIPSSVQAMLLSATLDLEDMEGLGKVVLRNPRTVSIAQDSSALEIPTVSHYYAKLRSQRDRFLVAYAMLRLNVLCGKVLIFVNNINSGFRLKLFLDQFKLKSAVLNSELPANSRTHCVEQFNAGVFDILIATDEAKDADRNPSTVGSGTPQKRFREMSVHVDEFDLSRGLDFRNVAAVLNFDVPGDVASYTHRAGRTARAGTSGTVLTLIVALDELVEVTSLSKKLGISIAPLAFRMEQVEAFRYRVEDCLRMISDSSVNAARLADVKREIINSDKLREYFDKNPEDLSALQHDSTLSKNASSHLAHIPTYLLPSALRDNITQDPDGSRFRIEKRRKKVGKKRKKLVRRTDPLASFSTRHGSGAN